MRKSADRSLAFVIGAGLLLVAAAAGLNYALPPPLHKGEQVSPLVLDREGRWLHAFTTAKGRWRFRADLDAIDPTFVERLIAIEDKRFWSHRGVDPLAVARAANRALRNGRADSGASTITMQVARLLEPRPRTIPSKLVEMARAVQIELRLSKREILELYLTLTPYGGNIEGVRAASLSYFDKEPLRLTDAEQALLIALPQAPEARRPDRRARAAASARNRIIEKLAAIEALSPHHAAEAMDAAIATSRHPFPRSAFHAARALTAREDVVSSTIDLALQQELETLMRSAVERTGDGANAAAMIVSVENREVVAAVGSSGTDLPGGWMDLTRALRSPGSALKPFIYGVAFDDGIAGPNTLIEDMPQSFDGYSPENFDRMFHGDVRVAEALQHSLNLPAVNVLDRLGADRLAALLRAAGLRLHTRTGADRGIGLTLALGGASITMRDLALLYAGLADGGRARPLAWTREDVERQSEQPAFHLFSEETAATINEILAESPSLEGRMPAHLAQSAPRIAMKTGTSYGYRDAWAAGHARGYAVIVWVGRPDGAPRPGETGRKAAAPLLHDIFDALWRRDPESLKPPPRQYAMDNQTVARFASPRRVSPPEIVFPRNGVELFAEPEDSARGFALAARGGAGDYRWYVEGAALANEPTSGRTIWRPTGPGFYDIVVVDSAGRTARAKVRVSL